MYHTILGNTVKRLKMNIRSKGLQRNPSKNSTEVSFSKLAEDHGKPEERTLADIPLYLRRVSSDAKFRAQWSIYSTIHFNNIDLWVFHVVVFITQIIPSWLETLTMSTPATEGKRYLINSCL